MVDVFYDTDKGTINLKADGGWGVGGTIDLSLKPLTLLKYALALCPATNIIGIGLLIHHFWPSSLPAPVPGVILTGCPTVFIGG